MLLAVCSRGPRGQRRQSLIALASKLRAVPTCGSASRARVLGGLGALPTGYVIVGTRWEAVAVAPLSNARDARADKGPRPRIVDAAG